MSLAGNNRLLDRLFLLDKVIREIDPTPWNICLNTLVLIGLQASVQDPHEESARSGRDYHAVLSYAADCSVGTGQLGSGHREHWGSANR